MEEYSLHIAWTLIICQHLLVRIAQILIYICTRFLQLFELNIFINKLKYIFECLFFLRKKTVQKQVFFKRYFGRRKINSWKVSHMLILSHAQKYSYHKLIGFLCHTGIRLIERHLSSCSLSATVLSRFIAFNFTCTGNM